VRSCVLHFVSPVSCVEHAGMAASSTRRDSPDYKGNCVLVCVTAAMSFPSQRDVDALTSFEDDEFDALLSGVNSKRTPSKSPATSSTQSGSHSSSSARVRSSTVAVSTPSAPPPPKLQSPLMKATATPGDGAAAATAPLTFGSTAFLSELQNRRKHVLHDNSLKAGASDDDADPPQSAPRMQARAANESAPKSTSSQRAATSDREPGPAVAAAAVATDKAAPDASACLRRLDRLPATVENCLKE
jgi:hypothetical protein